MTCEFDNLLDQAAMYAAGTLPPDEFEQFESQLLAGDSEHLHAFSEVQNVVDQFLHEEQSEEPNLIVRSNLISAIAPSKPDPVFASVDETDDTLAEDPSAMVILRGDDIGWRETNVPGVRSRNLFVDRELNRVTLLLKLEPGVVFPDHEHPGVEECLILEGDLELAGKTLHRSDYIRIPKGGQHGVPRTRSGCVLLVISPLTDAA